MKTLSSVIAISTLIVAGISFAETQTPVEETVVVKTTQQASAMVEQDVSLFDKQAFNADIKAAIMQSARQFALDALSSQRTFIAAN